MTSLLPIVCVAVMLSAGLTVLGHYVRRARPLLIYIFKPLTTILILAVGLMPGRSIFYVTARAIALGLVVSLAGDIWLMLPGDRFATFESTFRFLEAPIVGMVYGSANDPGDAEKQPELMRAAYELGRKMTVGR